MAMRGIMSLMDVMAAIVARVGGRYR
jgi:hypothetical protein